MAQAIYRKNLVTKLPLVAERKKTTRIGKVPKRNRDNRGIIGREKVNDKILL